MNLPEDDEDYLREKEFVWELLPNGDGACLVVKNYPVNGDQFDRSATDLMIRIPAQYNNAALDMFYADPPLRLKSGAYPPAAEHFETHSGRNWQRFSRHFNTPWRAGVDGLPTMLTFVHRELHGRI